MKQASKFGLVRRRPQRHQKWGWVEGAGLPWWPSRPRSPLLGLDNLLGAPQRTGATVQGSSPLAMRFRRWAAALTRREPLWKAYPGLFCNNPGGRLPNRLAYRPVTPAATCATWPLSLRVSARSSAACRITGANQYAQMLGIDENTLMAMRREIVRLLRAVQRNGEGHRLQCDEAASPTNS